MQMHAPFFTCDGCIQGAYQILVNPSSSGSQPIGRISSYQPVLVQSYCDGTIIDPEVWLSFHDVYSLRVLTDWM